MSSATLANDGEEDDYMSMNIVEPKPPRKETYTQRRLRKQRESEEKSRVPSKAERAATEAARRDAALASSTLDPSNPGFKMMAKLGYKPGKALGKNHSSEASGASSADNAGKSDATSARTEPLNVIVKEGRGGIGMDSEKKRKFREETEHESKRVKAEEGDFRERVRLEREEKRTENLVRAAQKVAERLDGEAEPEAGDVDDFTNVPTADERQRQKDAELPNQKKSAKPTSQINILYRGLVRHREEKLRELRTRRGLYDSLSTQSPNLASTMPEFDPGRLPGYSDPSLTRDDEIALGVQSDRVIRGTFKDKTTQEEELEEEDPELDEFNALDAHERLKRLVLYPREKYQYCFWCKYRYEGDDMEGCPGVTEEDHD